MHTPDPSITFEIAFSEENLNRIFEERISEAKFVGLDGISASSFAEVAERELETASRKVLSGQYSFTRYREKLILKTFRKPPRQIAIPTIRDAIILRALCDYLAMVFQDCRMKPPHDVIKRVAEAANASNAEDCFLRMDVVNFYPSIVHKTLLTEVSKRVSEPAALSIISRALTTPIGFDELDAKTDGVPQGLSISNILSMIYLLEFDREFSFKFNYFRYVDDIVILAHCEEVAAIHAEITDYLRKYLKLETHALEEAGGSKSMISSVSEGTDYLGYNISKSRLSVREKSYKKMFRAIVGCLRTLRGTATTEQVLWRLNLIITGCRFEERSVGWVFFFRQSTNMAQFHRMDVFVRKQLGVYGLKHAETKVKSFVKAYREIRYNRAETAYVPDFDNFTLADKIRTISLIRGDSEKKLGRMTRSEIDQIYWSIVRRQVSKMENETVDFGNSSGGS